MQQLNPSLAIENSTAWRITVVLESLTELSDSQAERAEDGESGEIGGRKPARKSRKRRKSNIPPRAKLESLTIRDASGLGRGSGRETVGQNCQGLLVEVTVRGTQTAIITSIIK